MLCLSERPQPLRTAAAAAMSAFINRSSAAFNDSALLGTRRHEDAAPPPPAESSSSDSSDDEARLQEALRARAQRLAAAAAAAAADADGGVGAQPPSSFPPPRSRPRASTERERRNATSAPHPQHSAGAAAAAAAAATFYARARPADVAAAARKKRAHALAAREEEEDAAVDAWEHEFRTGNSAAPLAHFAQMALNMDDEDPAIAAVASASSKRGAFEADEKEQRDSDHSHSDHEQRDDDDEEQRDAVQSVALVRRPDRSYRHTMPQMLSPSAVAAASKPAAAQSVPHPALKRAAAPPPQPTISKHALALAAATTVVPGPRTRGAAATVGAGGGARDIRARGMMLRKATMDAAAAAAASANPLEDTAASAAAAEAAAALSLATAREIQQQVLDEWTSSEEDDPVIPLEFQQSTLLSRTQRAQLGLKSMREICNLLAKPLAPREDPLEEYKQSGAFQATSYWPDEGRFARMTLKDAQPTHHNPAVVDPHAAIGITHAEQVRKMKAALVAAEKASAAPSSAPLTIIVPPPSATTPSHARTPSHVRSTSSVFHARRQSVAQTAFAKRVDKNALDGSKLNDSFLKSTGATLHNTSLLSPAALAALKAQAQALAIEEEGEAAAAAAEAAGGISPVTPRSRASSSVPVSPAPLGSLSPSSAATIARAEDLSTDDPAMLEAFSMLSPHSLDASESSARAAVAKARATAKHAQALALFAAAQTAPFVKLRRDLESASDDPFARFLASDRPLLTDAQIDALLAAKIDESVRKGFPRNRNEMLGMRSKGTILFGMSAGHGAGNMAGVGHLNIMGRQSAKVGAYTEGADGISGMFHTMGTRESLQGSAREARRRMVNSRPYSARTPAQARAAKQVEKAWAATRAIVNDNPPVGIYADPSRGRALGEPDTGRGPDLSGQASRDRPIQSSLGLGNAELVGSTQRQEFARPHSAYSLSGPGPADLHIARDFDRPTTDLAVRDQKGVQFARADVGIRVCLTTESGIHLAAPTDATHLVKGSRGAKILEAVAGGPEPSRFDPTRGAGPKVFSSLAPAAEKGVSFTTAPLHRVADVLTMHVPATAMIVREAPLQCAPSDLIGLHAKGGLRATRGDPRIVAFTPHPKPAASEEMGPREVMRMQEAKAAQRLKARRAKEADLAARRAEAAKKKAARAERLKAQMAERDVLFAKKTRGDKTGATSASDAASGSAPASSSALADDSEDDDDSLDSDILTRGQRRDKALRSTLLPAEAWSPRGQAMRRAARSVAHQLRTVHAMEVRSEIESARRSGKKQREAKEAKTQREQDAREFAANVDQTQQSWLFLIASCSRLGLWARRNALERSLASSGLLASLPRRVVDKVVQARNSWRRLVMLRRRDRAARTIQRYMRYFASVARRRRVSRAAPVLVNFFVDVAERAKLRFAITNFKTKIVRIQRWWRRAGLPILRARATLLERAWARTIMLRWEEIVKYRSYLSATIADAASGSYTSGLPSLLGTALTIKVPAEERQRFANHAIVLRSNEEEVAQHSLVKEPPAGWTPATAVTAGAHARSPSHAVGQLQPTPEHGAISPVAFSPSFSSSAAASSDHIIWERFVCALFLRGSSALRPPSASRATSVANAAFQAHARRTSKMPPNAQPATLMVPQPPPAATSARKHDRARSTSGFTFLSGASVGMPSSAPAVAAVAPPVSFFPVLTPPTGWQCGSPCDRALLEFEAFCNLHKQLPMRESSGGSGGGSSSSGSASQTVQSSPRNREREGSSAHDSRVLSPSASVTFSFAPIDSSSSSSVVASLQAPAAPGVLLRRIILRNLYLRLRLQHRSMIYALRAFAAPTAASAVNSSGSQSSRASTPSVPGSHWSFSLGLDRPRCHRWLHLLSASVLQECLMECMVPRSLHGLWQSGAILGRHRDDWTRWLRERQMEPNLQLRQHTGWIAVRQEYGIAAAAQRKQEEARLQMQTQSADASQAAPPSRVPRAPSVSNAAAFGVGSGSRPSSAHVRPGSALARPPSVVRSTSPTRATDAELHDPAAALTKKIKRAVTAKHA